MKKLFIYVLQMTVAVGLLFIVSLSIPVSATGLTIVPHASNNIRYVYTKSAHTDLIHDKCIFDSCYTRFIEMGLLLDRYTYGAASINYANNVYPGTSSHAVGGPKFLFLNQYGISNEHENVPNSLKLSNRSSSPPVAMMKPPKRPSSSASSPPSATPPRPFPTSTPPSTASMAAAYLPTSTPSSKTPPSPTPSA